MQINEVNWNIDKKNREIKRLKLIKRELSEREFLDRIKTSIIDSRKYRNQAFRLMKKYRGENEAEGVDQESMSKYRYQNLVLEEYEEMIKEVEHNKELLLAAMSRRRVRDHLQSNRNSNSCLIINPPLPVALIFHQI